MHELVPLNVEGPAMNTSWHYLVVKALVLFGGGGKVWLGLGFLVTLEGKEVCHSSCGVLLQT